MSDRILRRSLRLQRKDEIIRQENMWTSFPLEIKFKVLSKLTAKDLRRLALTSKIAAGEVLAYIQSAVGMRHIKKELLEKPQEFFDVWDKHSKHENSRVLGLLLRAVTFTLHRQLKIQVALDVATQLEWTWDAKSEDDFCFRLDSFFLCFVIFLRTFFKGWNKRDLLLSYPHVLKLTRLDTVIKQLLNSSPGHFIYKERAIRQYYQYAYFMANDKSITSFWLGTILMNLPFVHQARMLYILFGPARIGSFVDWESPLSNDSLMLPSDLTRLASVVSLLDAHDNFSDDDILTLIGEIIILPQPWNDFHVAHFLLSCGSKILVSYMANALANGRYVELSTFIFRCAWVLLKQGKELSPILNSLATALSIHNSNPADANMFLEHLPYFLHHVAHTDGRDLGIARPARHRVIAELLKAFLGPKRHLADVFQPKKDIRCSQVQSLEE